MNQQSTNLNETTGAIDRMRFHRNHCKLAAFPGADKITADATHDAVFWLRDAHGIRTSFDALCIEGQATGLKMLRAAPWVNLSRRETAKQFQRGLADRLVQSIRAREAANG